MRRKAGRGHFDTDRDRTLIRDKWSGMSFAEKAGYIWDYHGIKIIVGLIALFAAIWLVRDIRTEKPENMLYIMGVSCEVEAEACEALESELTDLLELDPERETIMIETSYTASENFQSQATISTYMQSGQVDLVIADEETFNSYAAASWLLPLSDTMLEGLTEESDLQNLFYAVPVDYSKGGAVKDVPFAPHEISEDAQCYGIYFTEGIFKGYVIGIMANAPHMDNAGKAALYLLGD